MLPITPALLRKIEPGAKQSVIDALAGPLGREMARGGITTPRRIEHFLAQVGHESDHFRTFHEYASGAAYEGRRDLGNIYKGDGRRFKGRGPIQITGRRNYKFYGDRIGVDLVNNPERAAEPEIGAKLAVEYWIVNGLNKIADSDRGGDTTEAALRKITKKINGGYNGLSDRRKTLMRAKKAIAGLALNSDAPELKVTVNPAELPDAPIAAPPAKPWWQSTEILSTGIGYVSSLAAAVQTPWGFATVAIVVVATGVAGYLIYKRLKRERDAYPVYRELLDPEPGMN